MNFKDLLAKRKSSIRKKWFDAVINDYPADSSDFLRKQKDRFLNPVGQTLLENINSLLDEIILNADSEKVYPYLNDIIKIKAVQDFSPSKAVSFIYLLKRVVREELESDIEKNKLTEELKSFETQLDSLALLAFDVYMKCRERIFDLRVNEIKTLTFRLLKRANVLHEVEEQISEIKAETVLTQNIKG
ncbi:MAG: RsbRD N-terminal domain-containing protein [Thermodesulfovibrionales bacterium]